MQSHYTDLKFEFGNIYLLANDKKLIALDFKKDKRFNGAIKNPENKILKMAIKQLSEYFEKKRKKFTIPIEFHGTEFQNKAWHTLLNIPFGEVISYGEQAKIMKCPKAQRAAGSANGKNPIAIIIPCHRIITSSKKIGGFSNDLKIKKYLLNLEGHQFIKDTII